MSEKITIDLDKLKEKIPAPCWREPIVETLRKCAVPDSPAPPPDDRLDVIFEFAELMGRKPGREKHGIGLEDRVSIETSPAATCLAVAWLSSPDAGEEAAAYCWRRRWEYMVYPDRVGFCKTGDPYEVFYMCRRDPKWNDNEALVRAVLAAAKAEKERT